MDPCTQHLEVYWKGREWKRMSTQWVSWCSISPRKAKFLAFQCVECFGMSILHFYQNTPSQLANFTLNQHISLFKIWGNDQHCLSSPEDRQVESWVGEPWGRSNHVNPSLQLSPSSWPIFIQYTSFLFEVRFMTLVIWLVFSRGWTNSR